MAEEPIDGVAYLKALKQATGPQSLAAPAAPHEMNKPQENASIASESDSFRGPEKRRSPRYKCEGSAELREDGCDVRTWATFTDVGLHGCYVEAQATYPAGAGLHMKMEVSGIRFETKGKVRVSYPYLGMGIAFQEMSDENLVRLKHLLASLSRPGIIVGPGANAPHPTTGPMEGLPSITNSDDAMRALIEFFEMHQVLMRDDFLKLVKKTQR